MTDKETIIKTFVYNFVLKDKKERCYLELTNPKKRNKFTDRLNHKWDTILNMKYLTQVSKDLDFADGIQQLLKFRNKELCYVISDYSDFDDQIIPFQDIFQKIYCRGFATLLINTSADTLFLDTEQVQGGTDRFVGHFKTYY